MKDRSRKKKKTSIFRIFLIPLIVIMLVQSMITIGTLIVRRTAGMLQEYSGGMMIRLVENRKVILQNDMIQRWAAVCGQEGTLHKLLEQFLTDRNMELEQVLNSDEMKDELLEQLFPECLNMLQGSTTTGIFVVLTGEDMQAKADYDGFFIRDSDPDINPANYTDLLLERGSKHLSREWNIPLDTAWTTHFHMDGEGNSENDSFFYEPWKAGEAYPDADTVNLGYWSMPFSLEKKMADSYRMITYSLPLRYEGQVYGVLGVEVSEQRFADYFPVAELNDSQQSGYMLAVEQEDGSYLPLMGKGVLYDLVCSANDRFFLEETRHENLTLVREARLNKQ